jgi:VIT1/CCC1 family predicted Fe2+/Mn2+ transporter
VRRGERGLLAEIAVRTSEMLAIPAIRVTPPPRAASVDPVTTRSRSHARDRRRWARYLADERAEAGLPRPRPAPGEEREILLALADAEGRQAHWLELLGGEPSRLPSPGIGSVFLGWMARRFGSIFVLALAQNAEGRSPYDSEPFATARMVADEKIHREVVRGLAARAAAAVRHVPRRRLRRQRRPRLNLALGDGHRRHRRGAVRAVQRRRRPLAGALSMGRGVRVGALAAELLDATEPSDYADHVLPDLDLDANELALVYRARGLGERDAHERARQIIEAAQAADRSQPYRLHRAAGADHEVVGSARRRRVELPLLRVRRDHPGAALDLRAQRAPRRRPGPRARRDGAAGHGSDGGTAPGTPLRRGLRQLAIGFGAAAVTYVLGLLFGVSAG